MNQEMKEILKEMMKKPKEFYAAMREIRLEHIKELRNKRTNNGNKTSRVQGRSEKHSA